MSASSLRRRLARACSLALLALGGCDGPTDPGEGYRIAVIRGDQQVAPVRTTLPLSLQVRVTDGRNKAVADVAVSWSVEEDGGSVSAATAPSFTDRSGIVRVNRTLGWTAGVHGTTASIVASPNSSVRFTAVAHVQGATQIGLHPDNHGHQQSDTVLASLDPYRVLVRDHNDVPVAGVNVNWSAVGGGSLTRMVSTTDASGVAEAVHVLDRWAGKQQVRAYVTGLVGSPVEFEATAHPGSPVALRPKAGDDQLVAVHAAMQPFVVALEDAHGNSIGGATIDWEVTGGGGSIAPSRTVTAHSPPFGAVALATRTAAAAEGTFQTRATASELAAAPHAVFRTTVVKAIVKVPTDYYSSGFAPRAVVVPVGSTVAWDWSCDFYCLPIAHNVVFEDDPTEPASATARVTGRHLRTFGEAGVIRYRCTLHSSSFTEGLVGTIVIQEADT